MRNCIATYEISSFLFKKGPLLTRGEKKRARRPRSDLHVPSTRLLEQFPSDQPSPDLRRSRADLVQLRVAQQAAGRIVVDVAVAAEALDCLERHPGRPLGRVEEDRKSTRLNSSH